MLDSERSTPLWGLFMFLGRFGSVGLLGTVVFFALLWFFVERLQLSVILATCLAFLVVVIENYILHYCWTFKSRQRHRSTLPQFFLMSLSGFFLNWGIMYYGVLFVSVSYLWIQCVAVMAVVLWNLLISSKWVFSANKLSG